MTKVRDETDKFFEKTEISGDCLIWKAAQNKNGNGVFRTNNGRVVPAHRWAYAKFVQEIPPKIRLTQKCGNKLCVNHHHMELETAGNILARNSVRRENGCIEWTGHKLNGGYGQVGFGGKYILAHRLSYNEHFGQIYDSICVLHKCDNRACINPDHLFIGTKTDNNRDRHMKGRTLFGRNLPFAKLTERDVLSIRALRKTGMTKSAIARLFNVSRSAVSSVLSGRTWSHVT